MKSRFFGIALAIAAEAGRSSVGFRAVANTDTPFGIVV
jgi:hypothetical protein